jgi:hypothetical protein
MTAAAAGGYLLEGKRQESRKAGKAAGYFPQPIEDPSFLRMTAMATAAAGYLYLHHFQS